MNRNIQTVQAPSVNIADQEMPAPLIDTDDTPLAETDDEEDADDNEDDIIVDTVDDDMETTTTSPQMLTTTMYPVETQSDNSTLNATEVENGNSTASRVGKWRRRNNQNRNIKCCMIGRKVSRQYGQINCNEQFYRRYRVSMLKNSQNNQKLKFFFAASCPTDFVACCQATDDVGHQQKV